MTKRKEKIIIVGAGLGGISASIALATEGFEVEVFEKNDKIGGKLNILKKDGFSFDLGPSIIILPHLFERLFKKAGKEMKDYVTLEEVKPQWRSFFEDKTILDLHPDMKEMEKELEKFGEKASGYWKFIEYSRMLYKYAEESYLERGSDTSKEIMKGYGIFEVLKKTDYFGTVNKGVCRYLSSPYLQDMMNFFLKYVGSSPYDAPALMNLLPYSQLGYGLWYVKGGMYNLAMGYEKLMKEMGIKIHLQKEVKKITTEKNKVKSIILNNGTEVDADIIVSNMEVIPAYKDLMGEKGSFIKKYESRYEPACSGLVVHLGVNKLYPQLRHHNFFFSQNPKKHFDTIHHKKELPDDPTIYLVCPTKSDTSIAPRGHEVIKILPHIPYLQEPRFTNEQYNLLKEKLYDKLERMGLTDLRKHIVVEDMLTPDDIQRMYYSNKGSIYGVVSNRKKNFALKAPKKSTLYNNLYFVGGSVNPGGGTPMVILSGQMVRDKILQELGEKNG